jgi:hypothetical protein
VRRERKVYILLAAVISFIIPLASVFIDYSNLTEANVPSTDLCFESPDQDSSSAGDKNESKVLGLTGSPDALPLEGDLLRKVPHPFSQAPSFDRKTMMLRC